MAGPLFLAWLTPASLAPPFSFQRRLRITVLGEPPPGSSHNSAHSLVIMILLNLFFHYKSNIKKVI